MFQISARAPFALTLIGCSLLVGCFGGSAEHIERASVSGTVTFDGKPLPAGNILFVPDVDASGNPLRGKAVQATITDGAYTIPAEQGPAVGNNKVQITATRKTGKFQESDGQKIEIEKQYLPAKYNASTTLKQDIAAGENTADFTLEAK
ncbi:hypothetical protein V6x_05820 [Gimesia chilikensis]|uniref:Carboxypeptidase regulatory-like domain-containing protein n=2 Tax=Gimesia TaxID=1649453 RepID=A0A6I6AAB0_9PLAN|nr:MULTISPECIES: hypothetical protein [Gimesia]QDU00905.1 hypothetical protein V6x_05820 [Gimesia chilikensis]QGQ23233.1 hypothetical protein F1728_11365 [Gimesia benthica]